MRSRVERLERLARRLPQPEPPLPPAVLARLDRAWAAAVARFREKHGRPPADPDELTAACTDAELDELERLYSAALGEESLSERLARVRYPDPDPHTLECICPPADRPATS